MISTSFNKFLFTNRVYNMLRATYLIFVSITYLYLIFTTYFLAIRQFWTITYPERTSEILHNFTRLYWNFSIWWLESINFKILNFETLQLLLNMDVLGMTFL